MNLKELEKVLNSLDVIDSDMGEKTTTELRTKLIRKTKEDVLSAEILKHMVLLIEIIGLSGKQTFKRLGTKHYGEAKARGLWYDTKSDEPEKIEILRRKLAYVYAESHMKSVEGDKVEGLTVIRWVLRCLEKKDPELLYWAYREAYLQTKDVKHRALIPDFNQWIDACEVEQLSATEHVLFMKEIASFD